MKKPIWFISVFMDSAALVAFSAMVDLHFTQKQWKNNCENCVLYFFFFFNFVHDTDDIITLDCRLQVRNTEM